MKASRYLTYAATAFGATALAGPAFAAGAMDSGAASTDAPAYATQTPTASELASDIFQVFFPLDSTELDADARQEISRAADDWERAGSGQVSVRRIGVTVVG